MPLPEWPNRPEIDDPVWTKLDGGLRRRLEGLAARLWGSAEGVDQAERVPLTNLDAVAGERLYGIFAPVAMGGLGLEYREGCAVVEHLASACLTTTFLWAQHFRLLGSLLSPSVPGPLRERWLAPLVRGEARAGVVLTGLMPGPARLSADPVAEGWVLSGEAPWVSGWSMVNVFLVVARGPGNTVVSLLVEPREQPGLTVTPTTLSALNASCTVRLGFDRVLIGDEQLLGQEGLAEARQQSERLRLNGSFALGLARRCCLLLGESPLDLELVRARHGLDAASEAELPGARAGACELAVRAAHALAVHRGSRSALAGDVAERSTREAGMLLVFGSRPAIRQALLEKFRALGPGDGA